MNDEAQNTTADELANLPPLERAAYELAGVISAANPYDIEGEVSEWAKSGGPERKALANTLADWHCERVTSRPTDLAQALIFDLLAHRARANLTIERAKTATEEATQVLSLYELFPFARLRELRGYSDERRDLEERLNSIQLEAARILSDGPGTGKLLRMFDWGVGDDQRADMQNVWESYRPLRELLKEAAQRPTVRLYP